MNRTEPNLEHQTLEHQVIALAAIAQAATLIDKLARTGYDDKEAFKTLVHGLLETSPKDTESVYVDRNHLRCGLESLQYFLQQGDKKPKGQQNYSEIMRLSLSMLHLQRKLSRKSEMLNTIAKRLEQVQRQLNHFNVDADPNEILVPALMHETVLASIASIYVDTLSTFRFRVQVNGNPTHLQQEAIVHKIRTLLLCGIRAAVLWQQMGGNRLSILLRRKRYAEVSAQMLRVH